MTIKELTKEEVNKAILSLEKKISSTQSKETTVETAKPITTPTNSPSGTVSSDSNKMDALDPKGHGSFSMNRKENTKVGSYSTTEGYNTQAKDIASHAEGFETIAGGKSSHAEGNNTVANSDAMHAAGKFNKTTSGVARVTGWGTAEEKKDIEVLDTEGNLKVAGKIYSDNKVVAIKSEIEEELELKADKETVEEALELKADKETVEEALQLKADKEEVEEALALKADKAEVNTALALKADKTDVVFKTDVDQTLSSTSTNPIANKTITALIPNTASSSNQLADKEFVNSSVATNTAYFKGTFNSLQEIQALTDVTNNDYAFLVTQDSNGNTVYKRYKYSTDDNQWIYEYDLNNSSFTAEQWASINSGITDSLVAKLSNIPTDAQKNVQSNWTQTNTSADDYIQNKPSLGTAAAKDIPASGNASSTQVVMGNDTRLSDARTPTSHTHTKSDITDFPSTLPANGGTAQYANVLNAWTKERQAAGNTVRDPNDINAYATMRWQIASSSMTDSAHPRDGFLVSFYWDNSGQWDSQLFIPNANDGNLKARFYENSKWTDWKDLAWKSDIAFPVTVISKASSGTTTVNFNNYTSMGIYRPNGDMNQWGDVSWQNAPTTTRPEGGFALMVFQEGNYTRQILTLYNDKRLYERFTYYNSGKSWSAWTSVSDGGKSAYVIDSADTTKYVEIAYSGSGLTSTTATHFAAWGNSEHTGTEKTLRDISVAEAKKLIGLGNVDNTADANKSVNYATYSGRMSNATIAIQTGSSKQQRISLQTLMTWLITTKGYIPSNTSCTKVIQTTWSYADNDILQLSIGGLNYELQLAGVVIEFMGTATNYNTGMFRLRIHSSPTTSITASSGYTVFPVSSVAEYTCNGSGYTPTWTSFLKTDGTNGTANGVSTLLNKLSEGTSDPVDNDYYIAQYAGGGTTTTTYHRRPIKALWNYIKSKKLNFTTKGNITWDAENTRATCNADSNNWTTNFIYSKYGYSSNCSLTFKPNSTSGYKMIGLSTTASSATNWSNLNYGFYCQSGGALDIRESGTTISCPTGHTTYAAGDDFRIDYVNGLVMYWHNGVLIRTTGRAISGKLYALADIYNKCSVDDFRFTSVANAPVAIDGATDIGAIRDCNSMIRNGFWYYTSNGPSTSIGASANDGAVYVQRYNDSWITQIAQDYRNGRLFVRGKNNGTWTAWTRIANYNELSSIRLKVSIGRPSTIVAGDIWIE